MKTQTLIISAIILAAFAGTSLAEASASAGKQAVTQAKAEPPVPKTVTDAAKAVKTDDDTASKLNADKQPPKDALSLEGKSNGKPAEEAKAGPTSKEPQATVKAAKHSAEKGIEKTQ